MAIPMTMAQLVNILYSVVDRMYLGHIPGSGQLELAGLGLSLPIISIIMGFANLCGMGGGPLCSIHRGRGEDKEAERVLGNSFVLLVIFGVGIPLLFLPFREPLLYFFGASNATYPYAQEYITIYLLGTPFVMVGLGLNPFINAQGFARRGMMTVLLGAVVNIVLDPVLIFGFDLGIRGAAWATVIAQAVSAAWVLKFLTGRKAILRLRTDCMPLAWAAGAENSGAGAFRVLCQPDQQFGPGSVQQNLVLLWRGPVCECDDGDQLHPGSDVHGGPGHHQRRAAGAGL